MRQWGLRRAVAALRWLLELVWLPVPVLVLEWLLVLELVRLLAVV